MEAKMKENRDAKATESGEMTLKDLILSIRNWVRYFWGKKWLILLFAITGAVLGFLYAKSKEPLYTASTSFVLESSGGAGSGRLGAYAGIASAFGIDLGAAGGLFEGENILELYRSRNMISGALLKEAVFNGKKQLLIDRYIEFNKLKDSWVETSKLKNISFRADNLYPNASIQLLHDSVMSAIVKTIDKTQLGVFKKDKKLNIIYVTITSPDELFAKALNEALVQRVNQFYIDTRTKKALSNVAILQEKADSVRRMMTGAIYTASGISDATPNQNITRMTPRVAPMQNARANAEVNQKILEVVLQNLELGKISLEKETPLIQIVDEPILPLDIKRTGKLKAIIAGGFISGLLILMLLMIRRYLKKITS